MMMRLINVIILAVLLAGCSSTAEYSDQGGVTPARLAADHALVEKGSIMYWGGEIVAVENYAHNTVLEIIAYPLKGSGEPKTGNSSTGRFLADRSGFLEPREYRPGRRVTISGPLLGYEDRNVGAAMLSFPALDVQQIQLWDESTYSDYYRQPRVNVGVSGGSGGGRVGVGIGF